MTKLMWALLPIVVAAAGVGWLALRGRMPSRPALNAWFSLLLMAYLLATAGLGIFWVANQQLPVFDWHYVFGYALLTLVAVHLGFNFRSAWPQLRRRPRARPADPAAFAAARRPALGLLSVLAAAAAAGIGFVVGLRHGRTELHVDAAPDATAGALALVEEFHAFSAHSRAGVLRRAPGADWGDAPSPFKAYSGRPR
jgi:hypothetical protein